MNDLLSKPTTLGDRVPHGGTRDADEILDLFLGWIADIGFELYPAREGALLEVMAGRHAILNTPTGSGKPLVALGLHFRGLCEGRTTFYTSPINALRARKFFFSSLNTMIAMVELWCLFAGWGTDSGPNPRPEKSRPKGPFTRPVWCSTRVGDCSDRLSIVVSWCTTIAP